MKYGIIAVLVFLAVATPAYAEKDASVADQVGQVLDKVGEKTNSVMDSLAERFGTTAREGFAALETYYTRRGYSLGALALFLLMVSISLFIMGGILVQKQARNQDYMQNLGIFCMILSTLNAIPCGICTYWAIDFLSGPRRHAINEIMSMLS